MMRTAKSCFPGLVLQCLLTLILAASEEGPEWMHLVTPAGEPAVQMKWVVPNGRGPFKQLTLVHRLQFDGVRYSSVLVLAELSSRLIPKTANDYEWLAPDGKIRLLHTDSEEKNKRNWRVITNVGPGETAVISSNEIYLYKDSFLKEYEAGDIKYHVSERDGVNEVIDRLGNVVIRKTDSIEASELSISGEKILLKYDAIKRLRGCAWKEASISFFYRNGLLASYSMGGSERKFEWGSVTNQTYGHPFKAPPPVVTGCGGYVYRYSSKRNVMACVAYKENSKVGAWMYFSSTGEYRYSGR